MPMVPCGKCGEDMEVPDTEYRLMQTIKSKMTVEHNECPRDVNPKSTFHISIRVEETKPGSLEPVPVAGFGAKVESETFGAGFDYLSAQLSEQWEKVREMIPVIDDDDDG